MESFKACYVNSNGDRRILASGFISEEAAWKYINADERCSARTKVGYYEVIRARPVVFSSAKID